MLASIRAQHSIEPQRQAADARTHQASTLCCLTQESTITSSHRGRQPRQAHSDQLGWFTQEPSIASSHKGKQHLHAQSKHLCNVVLHEIRALHLQGELPKLLHDKSSAIDFQGYAFHPLRYLTTEPCPTADELQTIAAHLTTCNPQRGGDYCPQGTCNLQRNIDFYYDTAMTIMGRESHTLSLLRYPLLGLPCDRHTWRERPRDNKVITAMFQNNALSSSHRRAATKSIPLRKRDELEAETT